MVIKVRFGKVGQGESGGRSGAEKTDGGGDVIG